MHAKEIQHYEGKAKTLAKLPRLKTDNQAERFVADSDLTKFDLSVLKSTQFEFAPKGARINMRVPSDLLSAVKRAAQARGELWPPTGLTPTG